MVRFGDRAHEIISRMSAEQFYSERHRVIFEAVARLRRPRHHRSNRLPRRWIGKEAGINWRRRVSHGDRRFLVFDGRDRFRHRRGAGRIKAAPNDRDGAGAPERCCRGGECRRRAGHRGRSCRPSSTGLGYALRVFARREQLGFRPFRRSPAGDSDRLEWFDEIYTRGQATTSF